jgi:hypothetical protein
LLSPQCVLGTEEDEDEVAIKAFSFPTLGGTWAETVGIFFNAIFDEEECVESFVEHTGRTPEEVFMNDNIELVFPSPGIVQELLGMNICAPTTGRSRMSINMAYVEITGPEHSANTIVHELVHAANCGEDKGKCLDERDACETANACVPVGEDCAKIYRKCKREQRLQDKPLLKEVGDV